MGLSGGAKSAFIGIWNPRWHTFPSSTSDKHSRWKANRWSQVWRAGECQTKAHDLTGPNNSSFWRGETRYQARGRVPTAGFTSIGSKASYLLLKVVSVGASYRFVITVTLWIAAFIKDFARCLVWCRDESIEQGIDTNQYYVDIDNKFSNIEVNEYLLSESKSRREI